MAKYPRACVGRGWSVIASCMASAVGSLGKSEASTETGKLLKSGFVVMLILDLWYVYLCAVGVTMKRNETREFQFFREFSAGD